MSVGKRNLALGLVAAALLAGCGDDDAPIEPVTTTTTDGEAASLSQEEFITSADARCAEANAALANLSTDASSATSSIEQERSITAGLIRGLRGIGDPEDPDGSLADFYAAMQEQVRILGDQGDSVAAGDTAGADALDADLDAAKAEAAGAAEQYGFDDCGQEGSTLPDSGTTTGATPAPATPTTTTPAPATTTPAPAPAPTPAPAPPPTGGTGSGGTSPSTGGTGGTGSGGSGGSGGSSGGFTP